MSHCPVPCSWVPLCLTSPGGFCLLHVAHACDGMPSSNWGSTPQHRPHSSAAWIVRFYSSNLCPCQYLKFHGWGTHVMPVQDKGNWVSRGHLKFSNSYGGMHGDLPGRDVGMAIAVEVTLEQVWGRVINRARCQGSSCSYAVQRIAAFICVPCGSMATGPLEFSAASPSLTYHAGST